MQETWVRSLGQEHPLEKKMATCSSVLAWETPWTEKPGGLQPMELQESDMTEQWTITMCSKGRRPDLFLSHGPTSLVQCHPEQRYPGVTGGDYAAQLQEVPAWSCENLAGSRHACWLSKKEILLPVSSQLLRPASLSLPQIITSQKNRGNQEEWVQIFHFWNFSKREYMSPS